MSLLKCWHYVKMYQSKRSK